MAWITNRGRVERGPFTVRHTLPRLDGDKIKRASDRPGAKPEVAKGRFPDTITFGAKGSSTATIEVDDRDLVDGPLARALKSSTDTLGRTEKPSA